MIVSGALQFYRSLVFKILHQIRLPTDTLDQNKKYANKSTVLLSSKAMPYLYIVLFVRIHANLGLPLSCKSLSMLCLQGFFNTALLKFYGTQS